MPPPRKVEQMKQGKKRGFTLSEVLITLGIIGVVAALVLPAFINEHQKAVTVSKLKKNYTLFAQVVQMAEKDFDSPKYWDYSLSHTEFAKKYFLPYLPTAKKYNNKYKIMALGNKAVSLYADRISNTGTNGHMYSLPDGTLFGTYIDSYIHYPLVMIVVDLNGKKGPNIVGKDVFHLAINRSTYKFEMHGRSENKSRKNILKPVEKDEMTWDANCAPSNDYYAGVYCGYIIMLDGWKISDDYPW